MKTKPYVVTKRVLLVLSQSDGWVTTACIAPQCGLPPEIVHRKARLSSNTVVSTTSTIIAQACHSLINQGLVEVRKAQRSKNEYKITDKGRKHLDALNAQEAKKHNAT
jgi:hypothetical protein